MKKSDKIGILGICLLISMLFLFLLSVISGLFVLDYLKYKKRLENE